MKDNNDLGNSVVLPEGAALQVRKACGLGPDSDLRILFFGGPGDVVGTFDHWINGRQDPRIPVIAYSSMFFTVTDKLNAKGYVLTEDGSQPITPTEGIEFMHVPHGRQRGRIGYQIDEYNFYQAARRSVESISPHVVIVDGLAPDALLSALTKTSRVVLTLHNAYWQMGQRPTRVRDRWRQARKSKALRGVTSAVCSSKECARQLVDLGMQSETCLVQMPQILSHHIHEDKSDRKPTARKLVYLGRVEPEKGVFDLLAAFDRLAGDFPDLTLDIAGTGSVFSALEDTVSASRWKDRIVVHGLLEAKQVHELLDCSDLLICPTQEFEGLALVVVEAAVHNVPTLASSAVPARELFPEGNAVFQAGNVDDLVANLRKIVSDDVQYGAMKDALVSDTGRFFDRSLSWGSMMYKAMIA